ncbi:glutamyl-tRNA amidotransferase [Nibricoccus aquaticus]|uniref:Glutamyl-tRNA amidotransferase n=1 Tax=Nibricoccus aquaticus TaxID=2576891 RepID=A0A290Q946_9BACT|nr:amidase family protein [Nibricoccus aquaticus]ATC64767.1 glutamyl-tRNA amidotransferase [Nibricoccus aquaticus]
MQPSRSLSASAPNPVPPSQRRSFAPFSAFARHFSVSLAIGCAGFATLPALQAAQLDIKTATIADIQAAYSAGLTSEKLLGAYLARIEAFDKKGPEINAVITLHPQALVQARALDAERKAGKVRGPLHGIPVLLKDNVDTFDVPTTGGSQLLEGSLPPDDAFITKKLRDAGVIILAKVNLSEWAGSGGSAAGAPPDILKAGFIPGGFSSAGGQTRNPHALDRSPSGSSGGTGAGLAAVYAPFGIGSDTGGSIRGPSSHNGIAGLKPTRGLMSRDGVIPLGLSYDTAGPMGRHIYDVAASLGAMTGIDSADAATFASGGHYHTDYTKFLKRGSLKGARIGVNRDYLGQDPEVDRIFEASIARLRELGAVIVDNVSIPEYLRRARADIYNLVVKAEFKADLTTYLKTTKPGFPKSFDDVVRLSNDPATKYRSAGKAAGLKWVSSPGITFDLDDRVYLATKREILPALTATFEALMAKHQLDALVYPTMPRPAMPINPTDGVAWPESSTSFANFTGWPDAIVPAGITKDGLPVTLSFLGRAWSEPALLAYAYDFEQATKALALPVNTPALPTDIVTY